MKQQLLNILYNPGSINTCKEKSQNDQSFLNQNSGNLNETDYVLLNKLEALVLADNEVKTDQTLKTFYNQLVLGISEGMCPILLKEYNNFLQRTAIKYPVSRSLFDECLLIVIEFKHQVDARDPIQGVISRDEWVELERSLFFLSHWESKLGINTEEMLLYDEV